MWKEFESKILGVFDNKTEEERLVAAHEISLLRMADIHRCIWQGLAKLEDIQSLEIDFTNAYCPLGCCRVVGLDFDTMSRDSLKKVCILWLRNQAEATNLLDLWSIAMEFSPKELKERF